MWPIWDKTGALCWLIILGHGQTQTVGESFQHHNPHPSPPPKNAPTFVIILKTGSSFKCWGYYISQYKKAFQAICWREEISGATVNRSVKWGLQIFWYGDKLERGEPTKTYRPNDLEEEGETAQTKHEKLYWFVHFKKNRPLVALTFTLFQKQMYFCRCFIVYPIHPSLPKYQ